MGRLISETLPDPDGSGPQTAPSRTINYSSTGRVSSEVDYASQTTSFTYNSAGLVSSVSDPRGTTSFTYDALGRVLLQTEPDPDGAGPLLSPYKLHAYSAAGDLATVTTALGVTTFTYDTLGRLTKIVEADPDGAGPALAPWTSYTYDLAGRQTSETNRLGYSTVYQYDKLGRLIKTTDAEGGETTYTYDAKGNRLTLTDPVSNKTTWVYDKLDRVTSEKNALNKSRLYDYDAEGNLKSYTDRNGKVTTYSYDKLHRLTTESWMNGASAVRTFTYSYDAASQLTGASDPDASYVFQFDSLGRNTSVEHDLGALAFNVLVNNTYDSLGRRTSLSTKINGTSDLLNQYQYDYLNRMTRVSQTGQSGGNAVAAKRVDISYNSEFKDKQSSVVLYADSAGTEEVATTTNTYDSIGRTKSITHKNAASVVLAGYNLSYDAANRPTEFLVTGYSAENATYNYDDTDQLVGADRAGTANDEAYSYDSNGNRTNSGYSTGGNNQLLTDGTFNYTYDDEGNRLQKTNIATGQSFNYTWDYRNRLTSIVTKNISGVITHKVDYTYDAFNRRIVKEIDADGAGSSLAIKEIYIYDGLREERGAAGDHILLRLDGDGDVTGRFLHGPEVDQVFAEEAVSSPTIAGDVLWALTDHLGTVRDLVDYDAVNNISSIANHIAYDAFGRTKSETNSAVDYLFGFTGRERDVESDLQYNRARFYDAQIGRWISQDPIGFNAGDANLYRYAGNRTAYAADPSGLKERTSGEIREEIDKLINKPGKTEGDYRKAEELIREYAEKLAEENAKIQAEIEWRSRPYSETGYCEIGPESQESRRRRMREEEAQRARERQEMIFQLQEISLMLLGGARGGGTMLPPRRGTPVVQPPRTPKVNPTGTPYFSGTKKPFITGATPNSIYTHIGPDGKAIQNSIYNSKGEVCGHVDFKNHGPGAPSGHGHIFPIPGNPASGHGPGKPHIPPSQLPPDWLTLPPGVQPRIPIGQ